MRWLITTSVDANLKEMEKRLADLGFQCELENPPVPLGEDEQVIGVVGPADANQKLAGDEAIIGIYPDSEYELYDDTLATPPSPDPGSTRSNQPL